MFKVGVSTSSSNTTILADVATEFDVNVLETIVDEPPGVAIQADACINKYPSSPFGVVGCNGAGTG